MLSGTCTPFMFLIYPISMHHIPYTSVRRGVTDSIITQVDGGFTWFYFVVPIWYATHPRLLFQCLGIPVYEMKSRFVRGTVTSHA